MKKYKYFFIAYLLLLLTGGLHAKVSLPGFMSDNMVMQRGCIIPLWGWADSGEKVIVNFLGNKYSTRADLNGNWQITLPKMKAGGPYILNVNELKVQNILVGDVFLCSGQSNMELQISRCMDKYHAEVMNYSNKNIRYVKIARSFNYQRPQTDVDGDWKELSPETAPDFAALCYFFAKEIAESKGIPLGIINSSLGGTPIEAWMSQKTLKKFPQFKNEFKKSQYIQDNYVDSVKQSDLKRSQQWNSSLTAADKGSGKWMKSDFDDSTWPLIDMFSDWGNSEGFPLIGSHWFRQTLTVPAEMAGKEAELRVGRIVDADSVFINGTFIGATSYMWPPRNYMVPAGLLRVGDNQITVRIVYSSGTPSFVKDKPYKLICEEQEVPLSLNWKYSIGAVMPALDVVDYIFDTPTCLYNGMIAPLRNFPVCGAVWYQGETNTVNPELYQTYLEAMVSEWREQWGIEFPFVIVQLANYMNHHENPFESNWAALREAQRLASLSIPKAALATAIDLGEWNDIHPLNKKDLAHRVVLQMERMVYHKNNLISEGPVIKSAMLQKDGSVVLNFKKETGHLRPLDNVGGIAMAGTDGIYHWAEAGIVGNKVVVTCSEVKQPVSVRYAWDDNPVSSIYNREGLPSSSFCISISSKK